MSHFQTYLAAIEKKLKAGDATEHTHRPALQAYADSLVDGITATNEPKRIACGAPDFVVKRKVVPIGYIEAKDVGVSLSDMEKGEGPNAEQFERYSDALPSWVLTDYLEFRWYVQGTFRLSVKTAKWDKTAKKLQVFAGAEAKLRDLFEAFYNHDAYTISTAKDLATALAGMARTLRAVIETTFESEEEDDWLHQWRDAFKKVLLPGISNSDFADIFAQTIAYGLFAARMESKKKGTFTRAHAAFDLPKTNPFLRKLFAEIAGVDMPDSMEWIVDDIVELLRHADIASISETFARDNGRTDPVVHFYETFLSVYNPSLRELRGVYFTPEPVVRYIVRSANLLVENELARTKGLANKTVLILDPATGTGTFLYTAIEEIFERFAGQKGAWDAYVADSLLGRLFGFELLVAPYAIAHLKLGLELRRTGYSFKSDQRLGVYLTNTLEEATAHTDHIFGKWISDEADQASEVKRNKPVLVVVGNPPYSGHSANKSRDSEGELTFIGRLIEDYKSVDGVSLDERNSKWLQDDYVKFIRFAEWRIAKTGEGVLGFITNNGYLDNATFRGMRWHLLQTFDELYVLDLHGSTKKRETDENVFAIQQGVSIILAVKTKEPRASTSVYHSDLFGSREEKYEYLGDNDISSTDWTQLTPNAPHYLFVPQDEAGREEYQDGWSIVDAMPVNVLGFQTHRDRFAIDFSRSSLEKRIKAFRGTELSDAAVALKYELKDNRDWNVAAARKKLRADKAWKESLITSLYRPLDYRWSYFSEVAMDYPRRELINHVVNHDNLCLGVGRKGAAVGDVEWSLATVSKVPIDANIFRRGGINVFPLYLYESYGHEHQEDMLLEGTRVNFSSEFLKALASAVGEPQVKPFGLPKGINEREVFAYIYAVLHSPEYRKRYADFLRIDFPRIPLPSDASALKSAAAIGEQLIQCHLLNADACDPIDIQFPEKGSDTLSDGEFDEDTKRVRINENQYFSNVEADVWAWQLGGFLVCEQWLKARKDRKLSFDEIAAFQDIVRAISTTIRLQHDLDIVLDWSE